jgi:hypothetical protein
MADEPLNVYADGAQVSVSPFTVTLMLTVAPPGASGGTVPPTKVGEVRMSLEHAKVMAIVLRKQLKSYEESIGGQIALHPQVWNQLGLSRQEDW